MPLDNEIAGGVGKLKFTNGLLRAMPFCTPTAPDRRRASMITEIVSNLAVKVLDTAGYPGAAFLMALESMIAPVPSEAVMPFVGFQVADGKWNLGWAILATSTGSIALLALLSHGLLWGQAVRP